MKTIGIIPARMASSRLPRKPMALIHGIPMVGHCWFRSKLSKLDEVYIATCDEVINEYAQTIGAKCIMTSDKHERATDRIAEAVDVIEADLGKSLETVVLIQGDEPMLTPEMIDLAVDGLAKNASVEVVNLMADILTEEEAEDPNEIKVVVDRNNNALYFSRSRIPNLVKADSKSLAKKQICIIPFRRDFLTRYSDMEETYLEQCESVDMMRILENGENVLMVDVPPGTMSVDTQQDLDRVTELMIDDQLMKSYA
ncbi:MAG: 3-deoxy-manno-octulosonate cytidylyltransferase [Alteromonadaceae bacterium]|nr:MAG: 3-deoxy-manno-octulosonate cytidylyltransferase [Alteromonadaceae bacterium]